MNLQLNQGKLLLEIAKNQIKTCLNGEATLDVSAYKAEPWLFEHGAVFVTLTINSELRGCIGSLEAYRPLLTDLTEHAINAAFNDPRFSPLTRAEFDQITIEVSVLTPRQEVIYSDIDDLKLKVRPQIDGVYLTLKNRGATFLPQVWEQLPNFNSFFAYLCNKAGLSADCLITDHPKIEVYQVQKFSDNS